MRSEGELREILETLEAVAYRREFGGQILFFEPYAKQREFFALGATRRERLLIAGNQNGKALRNGTPVLTPTGWRAIETLSPGDEVIGGDGNPCQVSGVYPQGVKPLVELVFDDGASVVCSFDHLWKCRQGKRERFRDKTWAIRTTKEMLDLGGAKCGHLRAEIPVCNSYLRPAKTDVDAYIVGLMAGDGCYSGTSSQAHISTADQEIVLFISKHYRVSQSPSSSGGYDYAIAGGLTTQLKDLGIWGTKAHEKTIPRDFLWSGRRERLALLQGLMDTDGFVDTDGKSSIFYSTSPGLIDAVVFLTRSLGGKAKVSKKQTYFYQKGMKVAGRPSWAVAVRLSTCPFRIARKASRWKRSVSRGDERRLWKAMEVEPDVCTCIAVDSPDRTYVTKDFIVTHNTHAGGFEAALHLTGEYPGWWRGRRFDRPTKGWVAGETSLAVRDIQQKKLCGEPGVDAALGTGMIGKDAFLDRPSLARGVTDAYDTIQVRHKSGGVSIARFKSYEQGRTKFQGESLDWIWFDEEPPEEIYAEGLTRTVATGGIAFMTFTPLKGRSNVVMRFLDEDSPDRGVTTMTIDDALHIPAEQRERIIAGYLPHEREARARGVPMLGSGRIFMSAEAAIKEPPLEYIPAHWTKLWGIDFGIGHPFAAALILWDRDNDVIHVHHTIRICDALPIMHAHAMKAIGAGVPVAWPQDGTQREKTSGETLAGAYKKHGLWMLAEHATWPDGGLSTEAGILEMDERMQTGRFKVAAQLSEFFEEYRFYHRKDGQIVKLKDDILSAVRIAVMMKRYARAVHLGSAAPERRVSGLAAGVDFDLFNPHAA